MQDLTNQYSSPSSSTEEVQAQHDARTWMDTSLNHIDDVLRQHYDRSLPEFTDTVIFHVSKLLQALKGAFFVREDDMFRALGGYACLPTQLSSFPLGEGLIGQAARSQESMYLDDIPASNAVVNSGLAQVSSSSIAIIPLLLNGQVYGVLELTTLKALPSLHRQLLERLGRNIASTLQSIQHHLHTKLLLQEAQQLADQMRAQEEELRQNLEELNASQEEMRRQQLRVERKEAQLRAFLDSSSDSMLMIDKDYTITLGNRTFLQLFNYMGVQLILGKSNLRDVFTDENWAEIQPYLQQVFSGQTCSFRYVYHTHSPVQGPVSIHNHSSLSPVFEGEEVIGATLIAHDFSELQQALLEAQEKTEQLLATEEELRQNLEELSASQELLGQQHAELAATGESMRTLMDISPDIMSLLDANLTVRLVNARLRNFFDSKGIPIEEGRTHFPSLFPAEGWEAMQPSITKALQGQRNAFTHELDGETFNSEFSPVYSTSGEVIGIAGIGKLCTAAKPSKKSISTLFSLFGF